MLGVLLHPTGGQRALSLSTAMIVVPYLLPCTAETKDHYRCDPDGVFGDEYGQCRACPLERAYTGVTCCGLLRSVVFVAPQLRRHSSLACSSSQPARAASLLEQPACSLAWPSWGYSSLGSWLRGAPGDAPPRRPGPNWRLRCGGAARPKSPIPRRPTPRCCV